MAALTGEPVELSQSEDEEPAEDRDVYAEIARSAELSKTGAFVATPDLALVDRARAHPVPDASGAAAAPVSPPAPRSAPSSKPDRASPLSRPHHHLPETPPRLFPESPGPSERRLAKPTGRCAAQRDGDGRRSPDRRPPPRRAASASRSRRGFQRPRLPTTPRARALPPRSARHQKHPRQSSPAGGEGSRASVGADARRDRLGLRRSLGCAGRHDAQGCFPRRRAARQAWRLHRRPHASQARRRTDQGRLPGWDRCSCLAGGAGTAGDDRHPHEDPRRRQRQWRHRACPFRNAPRRRVRGSAQGVQPRPLSRRGLRGGLREGDRRAFELRRDAGRHDLGAPSARRHQPRPPRNPRPGDRRGRQDPPRAQGRQERTRRGARGRQGGGRKSLLRLSVRRSRRDADVRGPSPSPSFGP